MLVTLVSIAAGCDDKPSFSDYDQSCKAVTDCAAVYVGPLGCCDEPCPNGAVRATLAEQARKDVEAARECRDIPPACVPPTPVCPDARVLCTQGRCDVQMRSQDAATNE